jgi:hypothetical protein
VALIQGKTMKELSHEARILLDSLIHNDSPTWWNVVEDKALRNAAMDQLLEYKLIEVDKVNGCRATSLGVKSNIKTKRLGLI